MRVVGLIRTPLEPLFVADGLVIASPGLLTRHPEVSFAENAVVRLADRPGAPAACCATRRRTWRPVCRSST